MKMIYAHNWEILKGEYIRKFPSQIGDKRSLDIDIQTWKGISIGAKHWMVKVKEERNSFWCEDENAWVTLSCDTEGGGFELEASVYTEEEAINLAIFFINYVIKATNDTHIIHERKYQKFIKDRT